MLTVTPTAGNPPRNVISLDTGDATKVVSSVSVTRDGDALMSQPATGFTRSAVDDYVCPYGKPVTYRAQGSTVQNGLVTIWDETWANLTSWTVSPVGWAVASGKANATYSATSNPLMKRAVSNLGKLTVTNPDHVSVELLDSAGTVLLRIQSYSATTVVGSSTLATSGTYSVTVKSGKAYVTCGTSSATVAITGTPAYVQLSPVREVLRSFIIGGSGSTDRVMSLSGANLGVAYTLSGALYMSLRVKATLQTDTIFSIASALTVTSVGVAAGVVYAKMSDSTYRRLDSDGISVVTSTPVTVWSTSSSIADGSTVYLFDRQRIIAIATSSVGEVKTEQIFEGATATFDESVTVTLDSEDAWIIHPRQPSLSVKMPKGYSTSGFVTVGDRSQEPKATTHTVLGSRLPVVTRFGSGRAAPTFGSVTLATGTQEEAAAMDTLLQDETPLFFNLPAQWKARLATAFYQVTSVQDSAKVEFASDWRLLWTLALQQARIPKTVVVPTWNSGTLYLTGWTSGDVLQKYGSSYDLLIDNRRA